MNYNALDDLELLKYLDLYSNDPLIRRLVKISRHGGIIEELVDAGMNIDTKEFEGDYNYYSVGDYIQHLRDAVIYHENEANDWQNKYDDVREERDQLQARSVADLLREMEDQVRGAKDAKLSIEREMARVQQQNKELQDKINVWTILEKQ